MTPVRVDPPLWLWIPERKEWGLAHFVTWPSLEDSVYWTLFCDSGVVVTLPNERVLAGLNGTLGRGKDLSAPAAPKSG